MTDHPPTIPSSEGPAATNYAVICRCTSAVESVKSCPMHGVPIATTITTDSTWPNERGGSEGGDTDSLLNPRAPEPIRMTSEVAKQLAVAYPPCPACGASITIKESKDGLTGLCRDAIGCRDRLIKQAATLTEELRQARKEREEWRELMQQWKDEAKNRNAALRSLREKIAKLPTIQPEMYDSDVRVQVEAHVQLRAVLSLCAEAIKQSTDPSSAPNEPVSS